MKISYGFYQTQFGTCLLGLVENKICYLAFIDDQTDALQQLACAWPNVDLVHNHAAGAEFVDEIFVNHAKNAKNPVPVLIKGTPFQQQVWNAVSQIPAGMLVSYEDIARRIGRPTAFRAVARAVGSNKIAYIIPCHRVIKKSGDLCGYRWGLERKKLMIDEEKKK